MTANFLLDGSASDYISEYNAFLFAITKAIRSEVFTAMPVKVTSVTRNAIGGGGGFLDAQPLIEEVFSTGETSPSDILKGLRYFRYQSGTTAFICDPQVGDIGLAVFAKTDVSNLDDVNKRDTVPPASYRTFSPADGFYFGGFWGNVNPKTYIVIDEDGTINIRSDGGVTINGNVTVVGKVSATVDVETNGISLKGHTHGGVERGISQTDTPS